MNRLLRLRPFNGSTINLKTLIQNPTRHFSYHFAHASGKPRHQLEPRFRWTKYSYSYAIVHPSLDLISFCLLTEAECGKRYLEMSEGKFVTVEVFPSSA